MIKTACIFLILSIIALSVYFVYSQHNKISLLEELHKKDNKIKTLKIEKSELAMQLTKCKLGGEWPHKIKTPEELKIGKIKK